LGASTSATCLNCFAFSWSNMERTGCVCDPGYEGPITGPCTACAAGKFKGTSSTAACTDCAVGRYSIDQGALLCASCIGGTYKNTTGSGLCTKCPYATYSSLPDRATGCLPCPANSECIDIKYPTYRCNYIGTCGCQPGTYGDPGGGFACTPCPPNTGSVCTLGDCMQLQNCLPNHGYYGQAESVVTTCPVNSGSNCFDPAQPFAPTFTCHNQEHCLCNAGYTGPNGGPCIDTTTPCGPGTTGPVGGPCSPCAAGTYKNTTGSEACTNCPAGTYKDTTGSAPCVACPTGYTAVSAGSWQCIACPYEHSNSLDGLSCQCNAGYSGVEDEGWCFACVAGTYKNSTGSLACTKCPAATYSATDAAESCMT
jgi:hypothetical protein